MTTKTDLRTFTKAELIELLTTDIAGWNRLYEEAREASNYSWRADLSLADLYSANLSSANLYSANLRLANLYSADLSSADLSSADLSSANLRLANLYSADLSSADLSSADLSSANLSSADLSSANLSSANLRLANLRLANLYSADLYSADLSSANLSSANLSSAKLGDDAMTVENWCDLLDLPRVGSTMRLAYKRLPADRITGRDQNNGKHLVEWLTGHEVEAEDWRDDGECGGGLHLSPCQHSTRTYSSHALVIPVAFDPADAVLLGDKIKVRKCLVMG